MKPIEECSEYELIGRGGFWYLGTPYSRYHEGMDAAYGHALLMACYLKAKNVTVYSPIVHSHVMSERWGFPRKATDWARENLAMLGAAHGLIVGLLPGWDKSDGLLWERKYAKARNKVILSLGWPLDEQDLPARSVNNS